MSSSNSELSYNSFSQKQRLLITIGCLGLVFSTTAYGLSLATIQGPMLKNIGAKSAFSLVTIIGSLAMCIMTPIGGRLCDIYGMRKVVVFGGLLAMIAGILFPFANNLPMMIGCRFLLFLAEGSFISAPYILARIINKPQDVPKAMGLLSAMIALGSFLGSYLAGVFTDLHMMWLAIVFPIIGLLIGVPLIWLHYPKQEKEVDMHLDKIGILLLSLSLCGILLALNFGPSAGWSHPIVLSCFLIGIVALIILIKYETKTESPLIPIQMFKNRQYALLLFIAALSVFYLTGMTTYVPKAVQDLMGQSTTVSGSLTIPRTIISVILPSFVGLWIAKNQTKHTWMALAIAGISIGISFSFLVFIGPNMPVWFVISMLALTGIADSFRSVCITPAAQTLLAPKDMGIGTSLIGFVISLSSAFSSAINGIAYDTLRLATPGLKGMTEGIDTVFLIAALTGFLAFLLSVFVYRKMAYARMKKLASQK